MDTKRLTGVLTALSEAVTQVTHIKRVFIIADTDDTAITIAPKDTAGPDGVRILLHSAFLLAKQGLKGPVAAYAFIGGALADIMREDVAQKVAEMQGDDDDGAAEATRDILSKLTKGGDNA